MARTKQTARVSTGGRAPIKQLAAKSVGRSSASNKVVVVAKQRTLKPATKALPGVSYDSLPGQPKAALGKKSSLKKQATLILEQSPSPSTSRSLSRALSKDETVIYKKQNSLPKQASTASKASGKSLSRGSSLTKQGSNASRASLGKGASLQKQTSSASRKSINKEESLKKQSSKDSLKKHPSIQRAASMSAEKKAPRESATKAPKKKKTKAKEPEPAPERYLEYRRGTFLALRNEEDTFFLCQAVQHVYNTTEGEFRIRWLVPHTNDPDCTQFTIDYVDVTTADCILTDIKPKRVKGKEYELPDKERIKIEKKLIKALKGEYSSEDEEDEEEDEDEEEEEEDEPSAKKARTSKKTGKKEKKPSKKVVSSRAKKGDGEKKTRKKKEPKEKKPTRRKLTEEEKKNPNLLLTPNPAIKVMQKDPLSESNAAMPFVSTVVQSKMVYRAVKMKDTKYLKKLIDDVEHIHSVWQRWSVAVNKDPVHLAIKQNDKASLKLLLKEMYKRDQKKKPRVTPPRSLLEQEGTGNYNYRSLGVPVINRLTVSRGSREGNNALLKDLSHHDSSPKDFNYYMQDALKDGVSKDTIDTMIAAASDDPDYNNQQVVSEVAHAVRSGHHLLAGTLIEEAIKNSMEHQFNFLHRDVLLFNGEELRPFREASAQKKTWAVGLTPIHCAAINPNPKYLSKLLSVLPEYGILDKGYKRPIHYAAACTGTGPLDLLLKRGVSMDDADTMGFTALHIACSVGRAHNVELLMKTATEEQEALKRKQQAESKKNSKSNKGEDDDEEDMEEGEDGEEEDEGDAAAAMVDKYGIGGINRAIVRPNKFYSLAPLHLAIEAGHLDVVKVLLKYGVNIHTPLSAGKNKKTPLMLAAASGSLPMVKLLFEKGGRVAEKDKLKCTPLIHAIMNGHAHVASYLLSLGADPNDADSSGNTCMHYAAAYGWYFCVKILLDAKADTNKPNDWKVTPMWIAFMKGHMGLVDILVQQPGVDINFQDDKGMTLLTIACGSPLVEGLETQIKYLIDKRGADCTIVDEDGNTGLHIVAGNTIKLAGSNWAPKICPKAVKMSTSICELLLKNGCDSSVTNKEGKTALVLAIEAGNSTLVKLLANKTGKVPTEVDKVGNNIMHHMASKCMDSNQKIILETIIQCARKTTGSVKVLENMVMVYNHNGYTPLLVAGQSYAYTEKLADEEEEEEQDGSEEEEDEDSEEEEEEDSESEEEEDSDDDTYKKAAKKKKRIPKKAKSSKKKKKGAKFKPGMEWTGKDQKLQDARDFIKLLIEVCKADVDMEVQKRKFDDFEQIPEKEIDQYFAGGEGKFRAITYMVGPKTERPIKGKDGSILDYTPGMTMMLKQKPELNFKDIEGITLLCLAIADHDWTPESKYDGVKKLVQAGADVDQTSKLGNFLGESPPVLYAARLYEASIFKYLVSSGAKLDSKTPGNNYTCLHWAASHPRDTDVIEMIEELVKHKADINARSNLGQTPLHVAAHSSAGGTDITSEVEAILIDAGADLSAKDHFNRIPLHYAFSNMGNPFGIDKIDPIDLCSTLTIAMEGRTQDINQGDVYDRTPLHYAASRGASVCCMNLTQKGASLDLVDNFGNTPIALAAIGQHESCAIMLLQGGADFSTDATILPEEELENLKKKEEEKCKEPAEESEEEQEKRKRKAKAEKRPEWRWKYFKAEEFGIRRYYPVFQVCVRNEWQGVVFLMLDRLKSQGISIAQTVEAALNTVRFNLALTLIRKVRDVRQLLQCNEDNQNLFHILCAKARPGDADDLQLRVAEMLLKRGVPLNAKDTFGCTPLHYAAFRHNKVLADFILVKQPEIKLTQKDANGRTAMAAAFFGLVSSGTENFQLDENFKTLLESLFKKGDKPDSLYMFQDVELTMFDLSFGQHNFDDHQELFTKSYMGPQVSPLILAVCKQHFAAVKYLLENKASVNFTDSEGMTPLMHAVRQNNLHIVKLLLDHSYEKDDKPEEIEEEEDEEDSDEDEANSDSDDSEDSSSRKKRKKKQKVKAKKARLSLKKAHSRRLFTMGQVEEDEDMDDESSEEEKEKNTEDDDNEGINLNFRPFKKKSKVDLNKQDSKKWSALHHLVAPLDYGTYDNIYILKILVDNGASLHSEDDAGLKPLDYALMRGARKLAQAIQKLMKKTIKHWEKPTISEMATDDGVSWLSGSVTDYKTDAAIFLKQVDAAAREKRKGKPEEKEPVAELDSVLNMSEEEGEVVMDENLNIPCDVLLTKIDVAKCRWGLYNFYKMQVVYHKKKKMYILLNRWGRIGDEGQFQRTPFNEKAEVIKEFAKIFRSKTGNKWDNIKDFEIHPNKYRLVQLEERKQSGKKLSEVEFNLKSKLPSRLPPILQNVMKEISNSDGLIQATGQVGIDTEMMPFGRIKNSALDAAMDILKELNPLVKDMRKRKDEGPHKDREGYHKVAEEVARLSNEYHHLVPHSGYSYERIAPLDDPDNLRQEFKKMENLMELELAGRMLAGAQLRSKDMNPVDYMYRNMKCQLELLDEDTTEAQYMLKYVTNSERESGTTRRIEAIFKVKREGEEERLTESGIDNHKLVFHGTKTSNLLSILTRGLLVSPQEAIITGRLHGNGVYFSDAFEKSTGYCDNLNPHSDTCYMLVCQVALGKQIFLADPYDDEEKSTKGKNSTFAYGQNVPNPMYDLTLPTGTSMPLGNLTSSRSPTGGRSRWYLPTYNEYVAYTEEQICMRYLVQFRKSDD